MALRQQGGDFVCRNGLNIPVVPVDQLPFEIEGLSYPLTPSQLATGHWNMIRRTNRPAHPLHIRPWQPAQQKDSDFTLFSEKKRYCPYWIKNGTCGYGEQCRYLHEMPDREKLGLLGFDDFPQSHRIENPGLYGVNPAPVRSNKKVQTKTRESGKGEERMKEAAPTKRGSQTSQKKTTKRKRSNKKRRASAVGLIDL